MGIEITSTKDEIERSGQTLEAFLLAAHSAAEGRTIRFLDELEVVRFSSTEITTRTNDKVQFVNEATLINQVKAALVQKHSDVEGKPIEMREIAIIKIDFDSGLILSRVSESAAISGAHDVSFAFDVPAIDPPNALMAAGGRGTFWNIKSVLLFFKWPWRGRKK